jgi:tetratricopeptide (TPR) repeat protein
MGEALRLFSEAGDHAGEGSAYLCLALQAGHGDQFSEAVDQSRLALTAYELVADKTGQAMSLNTMCWALTWVGDHEQAIDCGQRALELTRESGNRLLSANVLATLAESYHRHGQYAWAIRCFRQVIEESEKLGFHWAWAEAQDQLGDALCDSGDALSAAEAWRAALGTLEDLSHPRAANVRKKLEQQLAQPSARATR